jgi:hypothetical protein
MSFFDLKPNTLWRAEAPPPARRFAAFSSPWRHSAQERQTNKKAALVRSLCAPPTPAKAAPPKAAAKVTGAMATALPTIDIPHTTFKLSNGLTVIVHEDHKAPIVAVNIWYHVGSKNEPVGKTGFAHLFEHFFFNGSENYPHGFREAMDDLGANNRNGTTNTDRTNFFEDVPVSALERTLFLESDRMGFLGNYISKEMLERELLAAKIAAVEAGRPLGWRRSGPWVAPPRRTAARAGGGGESQCTAARTPSCPSARKREGATLRASSLAGPPPGHPWGQRARV